MTSNFALSVCSSVNLSSIDFNFVGRYTDRRKSAVHHFKQALSIDPLLWAAYEELCLLGLYENVSNCSSSGEALH